MYVYIHSRGWWLLAEQFHFHFHWALVDRSLKEASLPEASQVLLVG